jgi:hypothetical protein
VANSGVKRGHILDYMIGGEQQHQWVGPVRSQVESCDGRSRCGVAPKGFENHATGVVAGVAQLCCDKSGMGGIGYDQRGCRVQAHEAI